MRYSIDTMPVLDAYSQTHSCPFCLLEQHLEDDCLAYYMGDSKMESDIRIATNDAGFCARHFERMYALKEGKLGLALMVHTHAQARMKKLDTPMVDVADICARDEGLFLRMRSADALAKRLDALAQALRDTGATCMVCQRVETNLQRYFETAVHLWEHEAGFPALVEAGAGVCLEHLPGLLGACGRGAVSAKRRAFLGVVIAQARARMQMDMEDLDFFIRKFDYRNRELPWGASKTALPRTLNRLKGRIVFPVQADDE